MASGVTKYYVYGLIDPATNQCFYVGKGCRSRMHHHVNKVLRGKTTGNNHLDNKLKKILREHSSVVYVKFYDGLSEDDAFSFEEQKIRELGMDALCNLWTGGSRGRSPSQEVRDKKSKALKGRRTQPRSEETKAKIRAARSLQLMKPVSAETKAKISVATTGKRKNIDAQTQARLSQLRRERMLTNNPRKVVPLYTGDV